MNVLSGGVMSLFILPWIQSISSENVFYSAGKIINSFEIIKGKQFKKMEWPRRQMDVCIVVHS